MCQAARKSRARTLGEPNERSERLFVDPVAAKDRELLANELDDRRRGQRRDSFPADPSVDEHGLGLMAGVGLTFHHELRALTRSVRLDAHARYVAVFEPALEARPRTHHDPRLVGSLDGEEQTAGLARRDRVQRTPAQPGGEPRD